MAFFFYSNFVSIHKPQYYSNYFHTFVVDFYSLEIIAADCSGIVSIYFQS